MILVWRLLGYNSGQAVRFYCWFSRKFWDVHDYKVYKGGDDVPSHFYDYKCWNCGKKFRI